MDEQSFVASMVLGIREGLVTQAEAQRMYFRNRDQFTAPKPKPSDIAPRAAASRKRTVTPCLPTRVSRIGNSIMSQRDEFDTPGAYVAIKDLLGELVLFTPTEYVEEVTTDFGTKDAINTDLVVLTAEGGPAEYTDVMIFQGSLIGTLKRKTPVYTNGILTREGRKVLGVIAKGEAKKGQNAPYVLDAPDDAQKQVARDYLAGRTVDAAVSDSAPADPWAVKQ